MRNMRALGAACLAVGATVVLVAAPATYAQPVVVNFGFDPSTNPQGQQLQYVYIPGSLSVPDGGVCAEAVSGATHNWDAVPFCATEAGSLTVYVSAVSLTPYTGSSCGWGNHHLQVYLYQGGASGINPAAGCTNLLQDSYTNNTGGGALGVGESVVFTIPGPGEYTLASMPGCDVSGVGTVTGTATFELTGAIELGPCREAVPALSGWGLAALSLLVAALAFAALRRLG